MKIVFANSAWVSAAERLILRGGGWHSVRLRVRYGLFIHPQAG
ncbi:MAG: MBL fold metallo-hydrolase, partial [Mesorhizobium sp.]